MGNMARKEPAFPAGSPGAGREYSLYDGKPDHIPGGITAGNLSGGEPRGDRSVFFDRMGKLAVDKRGGSGYNNSAVQWDGEMRVCWNW